MNGHTHEHSLATHERTARFARDLLDRAGGGLTAEQASSVLGGMSGAQVMQQVAARTLIAVEIDGQVLLPAFQFREGRASPAVRELLAATPTASSWALLQFLVEGDEGLAGGHPLDMVWGDRQSVSRLVRFAGKLED